MARVAIVGGTGAGLFSRAGRAADQPAASLRWGAPSAAPEEWQEAGHEVLFLARHGNRGNIPPHRVNYRANIALIDAWQPDAVLGLNAVGGIAAEPPPGGLVLPHQLIDYTYGRAHTFFDNRVGSTEFIDFTNPYDEELRNSLIRAAGAAAVPLTPRGTYGVTQGPRLETAAEIDRLERDGCTVVGMTGMPEAGLAREAGLAYASLCLVVNAAAGRGSQPIHADIERYLQTAMAAARQVITRFLSVLPV
ncbi:MAG: S-methyl-5'-thioinosine phosphorylase [Gammaproteobacteria bacterium]|jgi:purine nucleoside phosphorylase|nr:S-methyl-5'-thioinosine phosphorylase [Gammaproteobacteria bacterium]